jgi:hypothetical protein
VDVGVGVDVGVVSSVIFVSLPHQWSLRSLQELEVNST